jgi:hypothetical protein
MPILSNPRHERFAQELANGKTATEAYQSAGFKPNRGNASTLKANQSILARVGEIQGEAAKQVELTRAEVLKMLLDDRNKARELKQMGPAIKAAELLGKELGMFIERHADVSAHYGISDEPQSLEDWALEFTGKPLPQ